MRKIVIICLVASVLPSLASAKGTHPMAGCGLGYLAFGSQQNSKVYQILAATVNNIVSPQTSAITSGTSGCTEDGAVKLAQQAQVYAAVNLDSLRHEMAKGEGEYVTAFASLLGATGSNQSALLQLFKSDYTYLFPTASTTSDELLEHLSERLAQHPGLVG
ncbi:MAG: DUF3015 family protein [Elusimicrobiota bacterium]|jgi:hypothetical protein